MLIYNKKTDALIDDYNKTFNDYDLKEGAALILKEANKRFHSYNKQEEEKTNNHDQE